MSLLTTATKAINTFNGVKSIIDTVRGIAGSKNLAANEPSGKHMGFMAQLRKSGVARKNLFDLYINMPRTLAGRSAQATNAIAVIPMLAESVNMPGIQFTSDDFRRYGFGPMERKPFNAIYTETQITFIGDGEGLLYKFFQQWMNSISAVNHKNRATSVGGNVFPFELEYIDEYVADITITTYNEALQEILVMDLNRAFPLSIESVPYSWSDNDSFMSFTVSFSFYNTFLSRIDETVIGTTSGPNSAASPSFMDKILQVGSVLQVLSAIKKPKTIGDVVNVVNNAKLVATTLGRI
jgi:hypothetical protein